MEITEVVLAHWNIVNNNYQQSLHYITKYIFAPNKSFVQLLDILSKTFVFLKNFNLEFSDIEVWFTDQNSKPLEIDGKFCITLVIN